MTVQELLDRLNYVEDKSLEVLVAVDEEGNGFNPLSDVDWSWGTMERHESWHADIELFDEIDVKNGVYDNDSFLSKFIVLWP